MGIDLPHARAVYAIRGRGGTAVMGSQGWGEGEEGRREGIVDINLSQTR